MCRITLGIKYLQPKQPFEVVSRLPFCARRPLVLRSVSRQWALCAGVSLWVCCAVVEQEK